jgi:hypothetical protein
MLEGRTGKDFWSGIMFLSFAALGLFAGRRYALGTVGEMGPGYFPILLSSILAGLGLLLVARAIVLGDESVPNLAIRPIGSLVASVVAFGVAIEVLGLLCSLALTVFLTSFAGRDSRIYETALLIVGLAVLSLTVFRLALRLPLPIWPAF